MGSAKAIVFPEPVWALPMQSAPVSERINISFCVLCELELDNQLMSYKAAGRRTRENRRDASSLYSSGRADRHGLQRLAEEGLDSQPGKRRLGLIHCRESRGRGYRRCFAFRIRAAGRHGGKRTRSGEGRAAQLRKTRSSFGEEPLSCEMRIAHEGLQPSAIISEASHLL